MPHSYLRSIQVIRALKILILLEPSQYGMSIERLRAELVESLGLSSLNAKTVKRDIEALQAVGFNISDDEQPGAFKLRRHHTKVPELPISAIELLALATARKLALPLIGTFAPYVGLEMLWHRLQEALPDAPWLQVEEETERLKGAAHRELISIRQSPLGGEVENEGVDLWSQQEDHTRFEAGGTAKKPAREKEAGDRSGPGPSARLKFPAGQAKDAAPRGIHAKGLHQNLRVTNERTRFRAGGPDVR